MKVATRMILDLLGLLYYDTIDRKTYVTGFSITVPNGTEVKSSL